MSPRSLLALPSVLVLSLLVGGCGSAVRSTGTPTPTPAPAPAVAQGHVSSGGQPVTGASVQLYAAGSSGDGTAAAPLLTPAITTDSNGGFSFSGSYTCPAAGSLVYFAAAGGHSGASTNNPALALMTAVGACGSLNTSISITIDERTTVAAVRALMPFMSAIDTVGSSSIDAGGLAAAFTLATSLANPATGQIPGPTLPANALAPQTTVNTLANILAACVNSPGGTAGDATSCGRLFAATAAAGQPPPGNTASAALNIMRDPVTNAATLFNLTTPSAPFEPQLAAAPPDWTVALTGSGAPALVPNGCSDVDLTGAAAFTNFKLQQPQICRKLVASDLASPNTAGSSTNYSTQVGRAPEQMPVVPPGFKVTLYASGFSNARYLLTAANGDLLLSQPGAGNIIVLRGVDSNGAAVSQFTYATGLTSPYGMAFYPSAADPHFLYVANTSSIVRFAYTVGDTSPNSAPTTLATDIPGSGNHTTRALAFTQEATPRLLVSVGSASNITNTDTDPSEFHRADILAYSVDGVFQKIYASGLRNPVGLVLDPAGQPWTSVNERDGLGDNVPADYVTHVEENGFYGWPWYYNGANPDPRLPSASAHPELGPSTLVGDTLLQPHFAPLQINFYNGTEFPAPYRGDLFVASHGSWNKSVRGGYELVRVRMSNGVATGEYEDFMTGFVNADGTVWGRPAGVAVGSDGALYVADDASNSIWRIIYTGA